MNFSIQPILQNDQVILYPLQENDFEELYAAASDPAIWAQHPNKNRWQRDVFQTYFNGAIQSEGAFKIVEKLSGAVIGSTRFYDYAADSDNIYIGYTFYTVASWGKGINLAVKKLMLDYIFQFVNSVVFHIGASNIRSQIAITRLGAVKTGEEEVNYYGEDSKLNFVYSISKTDWTK